jgi:Zn-dependent protease
MLKGIVFILVLFACVVLHELAHALTAKRYGIKTRDITLLPIGGMAQLERIPDDPKQEIWVTLAGSAVNVVIALTLFAWLQLTGGLEPLNKVSVTGGSFLMRLMIVNVFLVVFNMLPAFPMDGGRVLRALLAMRMEYTKATQIAASLGQGLAFLFGFIGLLTNPFLVFIGLFVWIGAAQEAHMVQIRSALAGIPVARAMLTEFRTLTPRDSLGHAVDLILTGSQQDFPVVEDERVVGVLTRGDLLIALAQRGQDTPVIDVTRREFQTVDSSEMLETAFARLQTCECRSLPVVHRGQLVGLITMDNVGEFVAIQSALVRRTERQKAKPS